MSSDDPPADGCSWLWPLLAGSSALIPHKPEGIYQIIKGDTCWLNQRQSEQGVDWTENFVGTDVCENVRYGRYGWYLLTAG